MAKFTVGWVKEKMVGEKKALEVTAKDESGKDATFTVWQFDKDNKEFPNFGGIQAGQVIEGNLWTKDGKYYSLYAPKPESAKPSFNKGGNMTKMLETKNENIREAQGHKDLSIKISSTMRDAVLLTTTQLSADVILSKDPSAIKKMVKDWRKFLWEEWDKNDSDYEPFPNQEPVINLDDDGFANF